MPKTAARDIHGRYQYDVIMYLSSGRVNNKGADQPAHPHSLISAFAFRSFESIISRLSVIKETGLSLALSKTRVGSHVVFAWIRCTDVRIHCTDILIEYR